jgi:hypothetical protein
MRRIASEMPTAIIRILVLVLLFNRGSAQTHDDSVYLFSAGNGVRVTIDKAHDFSKSKRTIVTFFALPNGNTTEHTMGRKIKEGDDWHFNIQHIRAQTKFIRQRMRNENFVVIYLENSYKSWPAWKQKNAGFKQLIPRLIDSLTALVPGKRKDIYLNGHSGGGSFIFGYLAGVEKIPADIKRISFLDSDYGYDSTYYEKFKDWLQRVKGSALNVFAYNDSVALLNGKTFVSPTGGTWYRSRLFLTHLHHDFSMNKVQDDSLVVYKSTNNAIQFYLKTNPEKKIFHTVQVERNGFIHSIFCGTRHDSKAYTYFAERAYSNLIE